MMDVHLNGRLRHEQDGISSLGWDVVTKWMQTLPAGHTLKLAVMYRLLTIYIYIGYDQS